MRHFLFYLLLLLALSSSAQAIGYVREGNRITITIAHPAANGVKQLRLEVIDSRIIRVQASPSFITTKEKSLIILPQSSLVSFRISETEDYIMAMTSYLSVKVSKKNGQLTFYDKEGKVLLREATEGKTFQPITVEKKNGYSWREVFDSNSDEAFYGLGQHQANEFNYKGKNEELFQYNTKVSIPFVISNHNYGLLWDSYSLCRFGQPNDYKQLNRIFKLYDIQGKEGALTARYISEKGNTVITERVDSLYFENLKMIKNLPQGFPLNGSNVTYSGFIEANETALYRFILYYAGYIKVYINNKLVVPERWRTAWNPNTYKFTQQLYQGERIPIRIEWKPDGEVSYCGLRANAPSSEEEQAKLSVWSEMSPDMDYYFIAGKDIDDVIAGYRKLTGKATIMPKWALGFWQSRERYNTQDEIISVLREFRKRRLPIDNIVQDWFYWKEDQWGSHQYDPKRFPDPQGMLDSIHSLHGHYMVSIWPKFYVNTDNFMAFATKNWMYRQAIKDSIRDWVGKGYVGSFYDAYSEGARKLFWKQINDNLYSKYHHDIDAWWMDASEPNIKDCTDIDYRKQLCGPTALGPSTEYFNAYALENANAIYNGQRSIVPNKRVFLLTRSGFAGLQRYSTATWSGDIAARWEDMRAQMTAGLNYSMSGIPFWGMDIGGFCTENRYVNAQKIYDTTGKENEDLAEWRELNARWNQFGAFVPLYRTHGQYPLREVWNLAPENHPCYKSIAYYSKLRYNLMPYLYSLNGWTYLKNYTLMRGLVMDFERDSKVNNIDNQWMFGPALMVCPIGYYKMRTRLVYFPSTTGWYDFYTGKYIAGGQTLNVNAPYERIPLFVREGSIIPFGPDIQYSDERKPDSITLYIYEGQNGDFTLYEDNGTNYDYEKGKYVTIEFTYNNSSRTLTIGKQKGTYDGMLMERTFNIVTVNRYKTQPYDLNTKGIIVTYTGKEKVVKL